MSERTETVALDVTAYRAAFGTLRTMLAEYLAEALVHGDGPEHRRLTRFARGLDEAGLNLDDLIDSFITGTWDTRPAWAWKSPTARKEPVLGDPWDDTPPF
ncbi:hypothetical protein [Streptomyces rubradiris]|uniref:Uncharacterized protein n=1 Tax=Streptomyces rubradiris TaxID=285531 RepID=A0ABQ3R3C2_STRRR|nr:hypothetical protein [Streptomyces rubradiris]GHH29973.1 hypothetical protein GCM10018792_75780 [Streptomyces rubradiris]GHI50359.1 hypothetical protein Srubr_02050 [Streptomyces rubradiris]